MKLDLVKLAEELEDKYWLELYERFVADAEAVFMSHPAKTYLYDNYFEEGPNSFSLELEIGTSPDQHPDNNKGDAKISREELKQLIVSLGNAFKAAFPNATFEVSDGDSREIYAGQVSKKLKITVSKDTIKSK